MMTLLKAFAFVVATFLVYAVLLPILISAKSWVLVVCGVLIAVVHVFATIWFVVAKIDDSAITEIQQ